MDADKLRINSARLLGRLLSTKSGRDFFAKNGYTSETQIIACDWDDTVGDVLYRVHEYRPPVVVAIGKDDDVHIMTVTPGTLGPTAGDKGSASPDSTIGMLYQDAMNRGGGGLYQIGHWDAARATAYPSASALMHA